MLVLAPLAFVFVAPKQAGRSFGEDLAAGLGFGALTILALQLVLPARTRLFTEPFGVDLLLRFHRQVGFAALALVLAHVVVLVLDNRQRLSLLNPLVAPWRAQAAVAATVSLGGLVATSLWRLRLRLSYEDWRGVHIVLAAAVLGFSFVHVIGVNEYLALGSVYLATVALVAGGLSALLHLRLGRPRAASRTPYVIDEVRPERGGATSLVLRAVGHGGSPFSPGQFAWLKLAGRPYALSEHPFSYASSAERPGSPRFTVKGSGDFTRAVASLEPGQQVLLDGPHGSFRPAYPDEPYLLIAGGIGITPAMSILRTFADRKDRRPLTLVYASRSLDDTTFREEIEDLGRQLDLEVVHVLSEPDAGWDGPRGRIDRDLLQPLVRPRTNVVVCGPPPLVGAVSAALRDLGLPAEAVHAERFTAV